MDNEIRIGSTLYTYDTNRRVYVGEGPNRSTDKSKHWKAHVIIGETRTSWILEGAPKADKKTLALRLTNSYGMDSHAYTEAQMQDRRWRDLNYRRIVEAVERADATTLRKIAALLEDVLVARSAGTAFDAAGKG